MPVSRAASGALTLANVAAQKEFARGLVLHYGFQADQARAAFERAAAVDPVDPLPRWAIAFGLWSTLVAQERGGKRRR